MLETISKLEASLRDRAKNLGQERIFKTQTGELIPLFLESFAQGLFNSLPVDEQEDGKIMWGLIELYLEEDENAERKQELKEDCSRVLNELQQNPQHFMNISLTYLLELLELKNG